MRLSRKEHFHTARPHRASAAAQGMPAGSMAQAWRLVDSVKQS